MRRTQPITKFIQQPMSNCYNDYMINNNNKELSIENLKSKKNQQYLSCHTFVVVFHKHESLFVPRGVMRCIYQTRNRIQIRTFEKMRIQIDPGDIKPSDSDKKNIWQLVSFF